MRTLRAQLTLMVVAILLGALVVVQLRAQSAGSSLDSRSVQELTDLIAQLNRGNDDLREQKSIEDQSLAQAQLDEQRGQNAAADVQRDISRLRGWAGLDPIYGPGIRLVLTGDLPGDAVEDVLNEIWSGGADGIAVGGVRIVPGVVVSGQPHALKVGATPLPDQIEVSAIGDRDSLVGTLRRPGGIIAELNATYPHVSATINLIDSVTLPPTDRTLIPPDARPRL